MIFVEHLVQVKEGEKREEEAKDILWRRRLKPNGLGSLFIAQVNVE